MRPSCKLPKVYLERRDIPQSLYRSEYFSVVRERQYSTARTDDFGKVVDVLEKEGWSEYGILRYSKGKQEDPLKWRRVP